MGHGFTNREEGFQLRGLVFGVISPLPPSLCLCVAAICLSDISTWMVTHSYPCACSFVYLFICLFFFSVPPPLSLSISQSPAPSVHLLSKASWVFICLCLWLLVWLQLKEGGSRQANFPCTILHPSTYSEGHLITFLCFPPAHERCKNYRGLEYSFRNLGVAPRDLSIKRDRLACDWLPHSTAGPVYSSTKMPRWRSIISNIN